MADSQFLSVGSVLCTGVRAAVLWARIPTPWTSGGKETFIADLDPRHRCYTQRKGERGASELLLAWEGSGGLSGLLSASFTEDVAAEMTLEAWDRVFAGMGGRQGAKGSTEVTPVPERLAHTVSSLLTAFGSFIITA